MTATVVYQQNLRTICSHTASGSSIETDAPVDNCGKGQRFSPTDLTATSLATCMLTVMGIKADGMGLQLDGTQISVKKIMKADPRRIGAIELAVTVPQHLQNADEKTIKILKHTAHTCPVQQSLHPDIEVSVDWGAWS